MDGVLLLDKPAGLTSQQCLTKIKKAHLLKTKIGHTGTLDPFATGLLPVCLGQATKISTLFLEDQKCYSAELLLGAQTDTGDNTGNIIHTATVPDYTNQQLNAICTKLHGEQMQTPPMYSAKKYQGTPLYKHARNGITIDRKTHTIRIYNFAIERMTEQHDAIVLHACCSKGTYMRALGETIAEQLGTCGHLRALRRTRVGELDMASAIPLEQACTTVCTPYSLTHVFRHWLPNWIGIACNELEQAALKQGQSILKPKQPSQQKQLYAHNECDEVIGLVHWADGRLIPKRLLC